MNTWIVALTAAGIVLGALATIVVGYWQWVHKPAKDRAEQRRIDAEAKKQADDAAHAEQMAALTELVSQIKNSHSKNFRDDMDEKFESVHEAIRRGDERTHSRIDALTVRLDRHVDK